MFGSLVRWIGAGSVGRGARPAVRFTPRLEALDVRANPSSRGGISGEAFTGQAAVTADVRELNSLDGIGSKPGGTGDGVSDAAEVARGAWVGGPHGGRVDSFGGRGGISGDIGN